jgi:hypothetical protein
MATTSSPPSATLQGVCPPQGATVAIRIDVTAPLNITPFVARQIVSQFVIREISTQLHGEAPDLSVGTRLCWSVPVVLTSPARGLVGRVGEILVDANTGELLADAEAVQRLADNAERLAERSPL